MRILHYALGFPPYRSGGLTKFCVDLMVQQAIDGHKVAMLWPGRMRVINKTNKVSKKNILCIKGYNIESYEIVNPLPVPLDEGIADMLEFMRYGDEETYDNFLNEYKPDVIHVHTLMGLHKSFLNVAKKKKIKLVFTAHDFFPICPKVTMFRHGRVCSSAMDCKECAQCNTTALSLNKIRILQSNIYLKLKESVIIRKIRKMHRDEYFSDMENSRVKVDGCADFYKKLREYYYSLLKIMDVIHYNSTITKYVYELFFELPNSCVINITHADIKDHRKIKKFDNSCLNIRYLGPQNGAKGYFILKEALDDLWKKRKDFCLNVHFMPINSSPYIKVNERYTYNELEKILDETDLLIAPSLWFETFGFTVLEALSYGVPVIISENVGAKDVLVKGGGIVIKNISSEKICDEIQNITIKKLKKMNQEIVENQKILGIDELEEMLEKKCYV